MGKVRGRFEIVCVFDDEPGTYIKITSDPTRSMPQAEIVRCLREYADRLEAASTAAAQQRATRGLQAPDPPERS